ncbi:MAG: hypothetical protein D6744_14990 [Planctomycetota bacterium]|nr:MAG: hypothetical protein D6744_14990 [Planctomycetota bacterium]
MAIHLGSDMKSKLAAAACLMVLAASAWAQPGNGGGPAWWPNWRGPFHNGAAKGNPPVEWSAEKNIRWKAHIPGEGHATPIVWGERIYIQTAIPVADAPKDGDDANGPRPLRFTLLALNRQDGSVAWSKTLCEAVPHERGHQTASQASNSPVTDGEHIFAYFGSRGLYCLDMDGRLKWKKDLGRMETRFEFGEGSSPALYGNALVIIWDHEGQSFIVALDKRTGEPLWRSDRDETTNWTSPVVVAGRGGPQVVAAGAKQIRGYDLQSGEVIWQCSGLTRNVVPTPVYDERNVYCTSGFRGSALLAVRYAEAEGEVDRSSALAWVYDGRGTPYVPSPTLYEGKLYFVRDNRAIVSCVDAKTGKAFYDNERIEELRGVYASLAAAADRVYVVGLDGKTAVLQAGPEFKVLAINALEDRFAASPVIVEDTLLLRGAHTLYCIAED